jgi:methionine synthase II (cobalamin-independent)
VPKRKTVVLGLVTTKLGALESKADLKRRIVEAARFVPLSSFACRPNAVSPARAWKRVAREAQGVKLRLIVEVARKVLAA